MNVLGVILVSSFIGVSASTPAHELLEVLPKWYPDLVRRLDRHATPASGTHRGINARSTVINQVVGGPTFVSPDSLAYLRECTDEELRLIFRLARLVLVSRAQLHKSELIAQQHSLRKEYADGLERITQSVGSLEWYREHYTDMVKVDIEGEEIQAVDGPEWTLIVPGNPMLHFEDLISLDPELPEYMRDLMKRYSENLSTKKQQQDTVMNAIESDLAAIDHALIPCTEEEGIYDSDD